MPNSKNMNDNSSSNRNKVRTSPDEMNPLDVVGHRKGMGEIHDTIGNADELLGGSSNLHEGKQIVGSPRGSGKENRGDDRSAGGSRRT